MILPCGPTAAVLAVADGAGGMPAGQHAAQLALGELVHAVQAATAAGEMLRAGILNGIERANQAVMDLGVGAATTLVAVEVQENSVRSYHVGDSLILVVGRRGKVRLQTIAHSPVGYAVESGLLDEAEALHHEDRHIVSNMVGSPDMRIEIGPLLRLRPHDTLLLATDGLTDNLHTQEIVGRIRTGPLARVLGDLMAACADRMCHPSEGAPSKPDDLACILFRRMIAKADAAAITTSRDPQCEQRG
ncbi:MAG: protein phosphatase 2C domain-containing protein [Phycisphaerales bacterium]|nr:MAG: protein phosphatase 2C domain-containing protein [Phycisphaerales bacterium]